MQKSVVFFSFHHYLSKRKAGFHWIAQSFVNLGWDVLFVTAPLSPISKLIHEPRWDYCKSTHVNKIEKIGENISISVYAPIFSPISLTGHIIIDLLSRPLWRVYMSFLPEYLSSWISHADLVIFESTPAILLFDKVKSVKPNIKIVYRVSDDLESLLPQPEILMHEKEVSGKFDLISVPSYSLYEKFSALNPIIQHHGINKDQFEEMHDIPNSYHQFKKNFIFVGIAYLDESFIKIASEIFTDYGFHIIGITPTMKMGDNVIIYGEIPFLETIPFIYHADVGLQTVRYSNSLSSLTDSLKVIQYTWCKLPIISPTTIPAIRTNRVVYMYDDLESIRSAVVTSLKLDRSLIDRSGILSWEELTDELLNKISIGDIH